MASLFSKDEDLFSSPPILGYQILRLMQKRKAEKISLFDVADSFKSEKWFSPKNLYFAMIFLFSIGVIKFEQPYIVKNDDN